MPRRGIVVLVCLLTCTSVASAQEKPAILELLLPLGATATLDGNDLGDQRTVTVNDLKPNEIRRLKLSIKFADGLTDERLLDVAAGQRIPVPVPNLGADRPAAVPVQPITPVTAAAVSPDGQLIAVGLETSVVVLWDTSVGKPVRTLAGPQKAVLSVAFSRDGKRILAGSADGTATIWDVETGNRIQTLRGHAGSVLSVAFSPDGARCLTGSADATARMWAVNGEPILTIKGHTKEVMAVEFSPDGATLATASADTTAALWDAATGQQTITLRGHKEGVSCLAFSPDGTRIATGSWENYVIIWEATTGKRLATTGRHGSDVYSVAFAADGRRVFAGDREEMTAMWDAATGEKLRIFTGHSADVIALLPSPDGRTLLTGSRDGTAKLWDLATGRELLTMTTDATRKTWAAVAPDGLFDGSEAGRHAMGLRFAKVTGSVLDQFFRDCYRPGLMAEIFRGQRPMAQKPLGRNTPPLVRIPSPKVRTVTAPEVTLTADVTDTGGGSSTLVVENNGVRVAVPVKAEPAPDGTVIRNTFTVPLAPGVNKVRVRAANRDGSWESAPADVDVNVPRTPGQLGRLYVVAVGVGEYAEPEWNIRSPAKDSRALAELLRRRAAKFYDRVDIVPISDRDATRASIEDTVSDVAELTRPQDALVVLLCGRGALLGDRLYLAPHDLRKGSDQPEPALRRGIAVDELASAVGRSRALQRALVIDFAGFDKAFPGVAKDRSEFGLRGAVERLARNHGVHTIAAVAGDGPVARLVQAAALSGASEEPAGPVDVADWFQASAGQYTEVQASSQAKGFPILGPSSGLSSR